MLSTKGGSGHNLKPNPNPNTNQFAYPGEETLLGYDDYQAMSGPSQNDDDDGLLGHIFSQHGLLIPGGGEEPVTVSEDGNPANEVRGAEMKSGRATRKRASGKTDRHSKIRTAQGLRDRRIRLSVQVSRKFFDLQDILGFEKASSTIEWLIAKSKGAIKGLSLRKGSSSSKDVSAECIVSRDKEARPITGDIFVGIEKGVSGSESSRGDTKRDLRERARVRARERTREKMMAKISKFSINEENPNDCPNFSASDGQGDFSSFEVIEKFLGIAGASESSLHGDTTNNYYSEDVNHSVDDRFLDEYPGSKSSGHFGGY